MSTTATTSTSPSPWPLSTLYVPLLTVIAWNLLHMPAQMSILIQTKLPAF